MSDKPKTNEPSQSDQSKDQPTRQSPPDGRGERPTDPNELAKWIVEQSTGDEED